MIILGIDPGLANTGFGAIKCGGKISRLVKCGHIRTSAKEKVPNRLYQIHSDVNHLLRTLRPDLVAIENVFSLVRYPRAGILLGGVLGVVYLSAFQYSVPMTEITTREVKNALVGYGAADKDQVRKTIKRVLNIQEVKSFHASDALAVALTAFYRRNNCGC